MIGSKFELNKKTYVLTKGKVKNRCTGCAFKDIHNHNNTLCFLACCKGIGTDRDIMCQFFDSIFVEVFPKVVKGVKKKLLL